MALALFMALALLTALALFMALFMALFLAPLRSPIGDATRPRCRTRCCLVVIKSGHLAELHANVRIGPLVGRKYRRCVPSPLRNTSRCPR